MSDSSLVPIRRALLSVSDKNGLIELARHLHARGIELISTGGTAKALRDAEIPVRDVSDVTGFPEVMDGRVKTLHPKIHGGLLGRRGTDDAVMKQHGIHGIDLLVVNLYPFEKATSTPDCTMPDAIENIDIGGPAMLRAAAKNHEHVVAIVDPADYAPLLESLHDKEGTTLEFRRRLAAKVYAHTAHYDGMIANWLGARATNDQVDQFPPSLHLNFARKSVLRYGENPHQNAALYLEKSSSTGNVANARILAGKELSYNNLADADAALECVKAFQKTPACVIVKHANPCGVAIGSTSLDAYEKAFGTDPVSAFGGIIAFNHPLDEQTARAIVEKQFVEVVIAPSIDGAALAAFSTKPNVRILASGEWSEHTASTLEYKRIAGGLLVQDADRDTLLLSDLKVVSKRIPTTDELRDLLFAWHVAMFVKSNAIVYARDGRTIGIGAGQMSRVISAKIAGIKAAEAKLDVVGSVMASDAFFPFRDGIDAAAADGIRAVIQPGGSMRDREVINAADENDMSMVFTGVRHFRH